MDISAGGSCVHHVGMAATKTARKLAQHDRHLTVVHPGGAVRREEALSRARAARRKLESRQEGERFAYLRRTHD